MNDNRSTPNADPGVFDQDAEYGRCRRARAEAELRMILLAGPGNAPVGVDGQPWRDRRQPACPGYTPDWVWNEKNQWFEPPPPPPTSGDLQARIAARARKMRAQKEVRT